MSGASEVPAIPEDVRKLVDALVRGSSSGNCKIAHTEAIAIRDEFLRLSSLAARPVDTGREKALEEDDHAVR